MAETTMAEIFYFDSGVTDLGELMENYTYPTEFLCDDDQGLETMYAVLYGLIFLLGMAGNGLMITVLLRHWRLLRITEIYLLHLALADLMLLCTFPFEMVKFANEWLFGEFLCKLMGLLKKLNFLFGSFLLACIGFDRYLAIVHAIPSLQSRRPRTVHQTCISLWLVCLGLSIPDVVFLTVTEDTETAKLSCDYSQYGIHGSNWVVTNSILNHVCFFLPLAVMSYCYTAIVVTLRKSQKNKATRGAIRLALLITLIFCFCLLPYNITLLIGTMVDFKIITHENCKSRNLLNTALGVTRSLGFSHCCLNPFLYAFVGVRFRNELIELLCQLGCRRVCLPFIRARGHSRPSVSDGATTSSTILI